MTVTVTEPAVLKVHERMEVPEPPVTVVGVRVHATLSAANATLLANPFKEATVIVEVPADPTDTVTVIGLAEIVKSGRAVTVKSTDAECERLPLVPVTVTVTLPADVKVHDRVEEPEPPVTVAGVRVQAALSADRATSLVNPFRGEMVMVEVPAELTTTVTAVGLAEMLKSGAAVTVKLTVAV